MKYQVQVRGDFAGTSGDWRPAVSGSFNQTGKSDSEASTFNVEDEANIILQLLSLEKQGAENDLRVLEV